jgi:hypothetical protein
MRPATFNVFDTVNLANPNTDLANVDVGRVTALRTPGCKRSAFDQQAAGRHGLIQSNEGNGPQTNGSLRKRRPQKNTEEHRLDWSFSVLFCVFLWPAFFCGCRPS